MRVHLHHFRPVAGWAIVLGTLGLSLLPCFGGSVTLVWDPSPITNAANYKVYYGPVSGGYTNSISVGLVTTATLSGLASGGTYYFAATVTDTVGLESVFSSEVFYMDSVPVVIQPPTLNPPPNITILENATVQSVTLSGISVGSATQPPTLSITAASSNPSLIPNPTVSYTSPNATGSLTFAPVASAYGSATITVTVNNGATSNNIVSQSFAVTVVPVNQAPTLNALPDLTVEENAAAQTVSFSGVSSGPANENQTLTVVASSSNPGLIPNPTVTYSSPSTTGTLRFQPVSAAFGTAVLTLTVNDGGLSNNVVSRSFTVHVAEIPTISAISNCVIAVNSQTPAISFKIGATQVPASDLVVYATSSNGSLITTTNITFGGTDAFRTLTIKPISGQSGTSTITVTVTSSTASASTAFQLGVFARPAPPGNIRVASQ